MGKGKLRGHPQKEHREAFLEPSGHHGWWRHHQQLKEMATVNSGFRDCLNPRG